MTNTAALLAAFALCAVPAIATAQDQGAAASTPKPADHFYRLNLVVDELNSTGQVQNSRIFVETIETNHSTQDVRTGTRVPIATGTEKGSTQFEYIDIGVSFDVREVKELGDKLSFDLVAEVSSLATPTATAPNELSGEPVIRQNKWDSMVLIPIGKPTVVFSADDLDDKGTMRVQVTATRVD